MKKKLNNEKKKLSVKAKVLIATGCAVLLLGSVGVLCFLNFYHVYDTYVIKPTCTANGYTESKCIYCHKIIRKNYTASLGHDYGDVKTIKEETELSFGQKIKECKRCGDKETTNVEPTSKMKKIYLSGDLFSLDSDSTASGEIVYSFNDNNEKKYAKIKYIDSNRTRFAKHNLLITFYSDEQFKNEVKVSLIDGMSSSQWRLYGDYYDYGNARNAVATELFKSIRATDDCDFSQFAKQYGVDKSEPLVLFMNNSFSGIYRVLEAPQKSAFKMDDEASQAIVRANSFSSSCKFMETADNENSGWSVVYSYDEQTDWVYNSLNNLIDFVSNNDGKEFKKGISEYLDVEGTIDYMLTAYLTAAGSNTVQNFQLATYDGKHWLPSVYNMNLSFGLSSDGTVSNLEKTLSPIKRNGKYDDCTSSELWNKMLNNFYDEIKDKYYSIKQNIYTVSNITSMFDDKINEIQSSVLKKDKELYPKVKTDFELKQQISDFVVSRTKIFDEFFK